MADLTRFMYGRTGMKLNLYTSWPYIPIPGEAVFDKFEPLNVKISGKIEFMGFKAGGSIEIIMPDTSPNGKCTVIINGNRFDNCPYRVEEELKLIITVNGNEITIQDRDKKWTWVWPGLIKAWIGLWPQGESLLSNEDMFKKEMEEASK
ncbi:MAG: hypothetical protein K6U80_13440 [Firmicutes bacterium]|nr:hypothetical protein [Bacillota bacterium]